MTCLWCDGPLGVPAAGTNGKLCHLCGEGYRAEPYVCSVEGHLPTYGEECATCVLEQQRVEQRRIQNAALVSQLLVLRGQLIVNWGEQWPGCEFGKGILGCALDGGLRDLGVQL